MRPLTCEKTEMTPLSTDFISARKFSTQITSSDVFQKMARTSRSTDLYDSSIL
ncbi:hypothetical protein HMPREF7215_1430 [Pyramidobacter piscolens W5455]|uniref:Uncharacterized protein n=1 Tax=Pyramidobacter piscolens W5455 TaxID=352165 RepID=A0ABP2HXT9_9BACT|nr:hypothetical protein HMPREF7215_1430 [Pyramidobacter piscolens W5455]